MLIIGLVQEIVMKVCPIGIFINAAKIRLSTILQLNIFLAKFPLQLLFDVKNILKGTILYFRRKFECMWHGNLKGDSLIT